MLLLVTIGDTQEQNNDASQHLNVANRFCSSFALLTSMLGSVEAIQGTAYNRGPV